MIEDSRTCPQCKSKKTIALNDTWRRCKNCRHVYRRQKLAAIATSTRTTEREG